MFLTLALSPKGGRSILLENASRADHLALVSAIAAAAPAEVAGLELWSSGSGREKVVAVTPAEDAPALKDLLKELEDARKAEEGKIAKAVKKDLEAAKPFFEAQAAKSAKKAAKKKSAKKAAKPKK
jgi:hypothetical protein